MRPSLNFRSSSALLLIALALPVAGLLRADQTVPNATVAAGQTLQVTDPGKVTTTESTIDVQVGGKAGFVAGVSVTLSPGFHVANGALFRAARDVNGGGLTNLDDSDFDGLPDAWEILHFGNLTTVDGAGDYDGDGISNAAEYAAGTDPKVNEATATIPGAVQVVIRTPSGKYQGVKTDWSIIPVP